MTEWDVSESDHELCLVLNVEMLDNDYTSLDISKDNQLYIIPDSCVARERCLILCW